MTSDAGLTSQDSDDPMAIQAVLDELHQLQQSPRLVTSPEELEALEHASRQHTDHLGSFLGGYHLQQALNSAALHAEQARLGEPVASASEERRHSHGDGSHRSRVYRAGAGDL